MTNLNNNGRELNIDELECASGGSVVTQYIQAFKEGVARGTPYGQGQNDLGQKFQQILQQLTPQG